MGILVAMAFAVRDTHHRTKQKSRVQLVSGRDMILPINHLANWRLIRQRKQAQIDKDVIREKSTRVDYDYRIRDWVMVREKIDVKYEIPFKVPYEIFQTWTNRNVTIQMGAVTDRLNIRRVNPYKIPEVD